jgi:hypothetical protein
LKQKEAKLKEVKTKLQLKTTEATKKENLLKEKTVKLTKTEIMLK